MEKEDFVFYRQLEKEVESWLGEGLITPQQKGKILDRYQKIKRMEEKAGPGKLVATISVLGSILVGVGIILFIAANWSAIPKWSKLFIIFASMLVSYGLGYYLRYEKENYPKVGAALILLGSIIFGAGIFLIAQIYHITVHYPNGPLMWGLAVLPLAYLLRQKTLVSLAVLDLLVWLGMETYYRLVVFSSIAPTLTPVLNLFFMAGLVLWGLGLMHRWYDPLKKISGVYLIFGVSITALAGYLMTFTIFILMSKFGAKDIFEFYLAMGGLLFLFILVSLFSRNKDRLWIPELLALALLMAGAFYLAFSFESEVMPPVYSNLRLIINLVFALMVIGLIFLGYIKRYPAYVNIGLLFFVLDVIARYFDFFWKLLPRSLFFIVGGVMLLAGGALLERQRRKVLASFKI